jgi:hypothetical protein
VYSRTHLTVQVIVRKWLRPVIDVSKDRKSNGTMEGI